MSLLHFLTIGFLEASRVGLRQAEALRPLSPAVLGLLDTFVVVVDGAATMEGAPVVVTSTLIRCPWYAPRHIRTAERFAVEAARLGCLVVDIEHGRIVDVVEFA